MVFLVNKSSKPEIKVKLSTKQSFFNIFFPQKKQREVLDTHVGINRKAEGKKKIKARTRIHMTKNRNVKNMAYGKEN